MDIRTGFGYDIHRLEEKLDAKALRLAGVLIPGGKVIAHSDGDCLFHSLSNAILSGLGKEDIGVYFPDNVQETKDMNSKDILHFAFQQMKKEGYFISNLTVTIILEKIKLKDYKEQMKEEIMKELSLQQNQIAIHANTNEGLDALGRGDAVVVYSQVCLIKM